MEPSTAARLPEPAIPSDLTEAERKFALGLPRTPDETEEAIQSLAARALASPEGYLAFGSPDDA
jgi:hypothetical protein